MGIVTLTLLNEPRHSVRLVTCSQLWGCYTTAAVIVKGLRRHVAAITNQNGDHHPEVVVMSQHMPHTALLESLMKGTALMWGDEGGNVFGCPNINHAYAMDLTKHRSCPR